MKRTILFLISFVPGFTGTAQTIRIADNNANRPTGVNIYATVQAAVDAAVAGDIVYVQPSLTSYGDVTINKQITLRGIGFNTGKDLGYQSTIGNIALTNRPDNTSNASGTVIDGLALNFVWMASQSSAFAYTLSDVTIKNCTINSLWRWVSGYVPVQNLTLSDNTIYFLLFVEATIDQLKMHRNIITGGLQFGIVTGVGAAGNPCNCAAGGSGTLSSSVFTNNIFLQAGNTIFNCNINSVIISNSNFLGGNNVAGSRFMSGKLTDAVVANNIFYGCSPTSNGGLFENNLFSNNLSFGTTNNALPPAGTGFGNTGSNNIINQDPLFVNAAYNTVFASTMDFNLQPSSPAKNAGSDGTDIGITGGAYPITSGNILLKPSSVPVMMSLNPAAMVPQNQSVKANIKAKSN
jgi:hypothetical protein